MTPRRLTATNFRTWEHLDLELPQGVTAIIGQNGAGKSSLLTLIDLCLFGARSLADHLTTGEDAMQIQIEFEHRGELLRVRRTYSARGRGQSKVDLERYALRANVGGQVVDFPEVTSGEGDWHPLTRESAAETQALIEATLGLSRATFRASAFLAQGDGAAFTEASPRDRKQILADILDLSIWDRLLQLARADRASVETDLAKLSGRIEIADQELASRESVASQRAGLLTDRATATVTLATQEQRFAELDARIRAGRDAAAELAGLRKLEAELAGALADTDTRIGTLTDEDVTIQEQLADRDTLATLATTVADLERAVEGRRELADAKREYQDAAVAVREYEDSISLANVELLEIEHAEQPVCPTCAQYLPDEARTITVRKIEARLDDARQSFAAARNAEQEASRRHEAAFCGLGAWADNDPGPMLDKARAAATTLATLDTMAQRLPQIRAETETLLATLEQKGRDLAAVRCQIAELAGRAHEPGAAEKVADLVNAMTETTQRITELDRSIARHDATLERLDTLADQATEDRAHAAALAERLDTIRHLERAYGPNGIPALILENTAIPQLETETNRILAELDTTYRVELRTQRALKTGDGHRDALDIVVTDNGTERLYETFSGGERTRLNLALRIALARLLAHRKGADVRLLALDEPDHLDEHGMDSLARVLGGLAGDFDAIVVVSHVPALREAFDQTIEIQKADGRSQIAAQTAPMEVAA